MPKPKRDLPDLARRLQKALDERGLSVSEAARMAAMQKQSCWLIVTGKNKNPGILTIQKLLDGIGATMSELYAPED